MIKTIIVDDHVLYREGVRFTLEKMNCCPVTVIGEAGSGAEFFMLLAAGNVPQLVLLDIVLPDTSGVQVARRLKKEFPETKVIMLSSEVSEELITELLDIGVDGYMSKLARKEDIETALCTVIGGSQYFGRSVARVMYDIYLTKMREKDKQVSGKEKTSNEIKEKSKPLDLTQREKEIIKLMCNGMQVKEIASKVNLSPRTVESHKSSILKKLGFNNTIDVIKYAVKNNIVEW